MFLVVFSILVVVFWRCFFTVARGQCVYKEQLDGIKYSLYPKILVRE